MKKCPFCGADIEETARFCLYCMNSLTEKEHIISHQKKKPHWLLLVVTIVTLSLTLAIVWFFSHVVPRNNNEKHHIHIYSIENTTIKYQQKEATCTTPATYYYSCLCGEKGSETFFYGELGEHIVVTETGYSADCVNTGLTDGTYCSVCNTVFLSQSPIPVINHTFDNDQDESCNVCNYIRVLSCNHSETIKLSAISPTCTNRGLTEGRKCALCQEILTAQTILAPSGHTVAPDSAIAPTCTTTGKTEGSHCTVCQVVLIPQQVVAKLEHSFDPEKPLSSCLVCGIQQSHVHNYSEKNTAIQYQKSAATCITSAVYYYSCICGEKGSDTFDGEVIPHTVVTIPGYPPDCVNTGLTDKKYCSFCQEVLDYHYDIIPNGHTFKLGDYSPVCLVCGEKGTIVFQALEVPLDFFDRILVNSCTYTINQSTEDTMNLIICLNVTNITSEKILIHSTGKVFSPVDSSWMDCYAFETNWLEPNESVDYQLIIKDLPISESIYILELE